MLNPHISLSTAAKRAVGFATFLVLLVIWSFVSLTGLVSSNKLPSPLAVVNALSYLSWDGGHSLLFSAATASICRILTAALFVMLIGIPLGVLMGAAPGIGAAISPLIDPFRSAPVVALLPILVMWLGIGEQMKIAFLFLGAVVFLIPMVRDAVRDVPYAYWESTRDLGATHLECITKCVLPLAMPRIVDALITSIAISWGYITVAEYVNADDGLGQLIQNARRFSAMDQVIAGIMVIIVLAHITNTTLIALRRRWYSWTV